MPQKPEIAIEGDLEVPTAGDADGSAVRWTDWRNEGGDA